jgi:hypothetical protein
MHPEPPLCCPYCGEPDASVFTVSYDAMVDGAGCEESEERCDACVGGESACEQTEAAE